MASVEDFLISFGIKVLSVFLSREEANVEDELKMQKENEERNETLWEI